MFISRLIRSLAILCLLFQPNFGQNQPQPCHLFLIQTKGKYGFIDRNGKVAIPPSFENAGGFHDGLALAQKGDKWGYVDCTGDFVIEPKFEDAQVWEDQTLGGVPGIVGSASSETSNTQTPSTWMKAFPFSDGLAVVQRTTHDRSKFWGQDELRMGFIDKKGNVVIQPQFTWAGPFSEGVAAIQVGKKFGYIDKTGKMVVPAQYDEAGKFSEGLAPVRVNQEWGYINKQGTMVIPPQFDLGKPFCQGLALVILKKPVKRAYRVLIDPAGNVAFFPDVSLGDGMVDGMASFESFGKNVGWGFMDKKGKVVVPNKFAFAGEFSHGLARVSTQKEFDAGVWSYIDSKGQIIWSPK